MDNILQTVLASFAIGLLASICGNYVYYRMCHGQNQKRGRNRH